MTKHRPQDWDCDVLDERPPIDGPMQLMAWKRIAASELPWRVRDRRSGIVMLLCPRISLIVGSSPLEVGHQPDETLLSVRIASPFYLGETAVTQAQWERLMTGNPSVHQGDDFPVENVSAWQCLDFAKRCGPGFRFPNEVEWEYACRADSSTPFSHSDWLDADEANYNGHYPYPGSPEGVKRGTTVAVRSLPPNRWGFYEMHGNVWEWCSAAPARIQALGADGVPTVLRGGSWGNHAHSCRCASRIVRAPNYTRMTAGFRLARDA